MPGEQIHEMSNKTTIKLGGSFCNFLTLLFITLKLTGVIDWSWWLVLSPLLVNIALIFLFLVCVFILDIISKK
jgi:hypothetical protein